MTTQALERQPVKVGIITTPSEFKGSLAGWREKRFHVLTPAADFTALPPQWGLLPVKVQINQDEQGGEVYQDKLFCKDGEVCLTKIGLTKVAQAAGMSIKTERMDNRMIPNYWEVRATVRVMGLDGTPQEWSATEELDLRDGTERSKKVLGKNNASAALAQARAKGMRGCEARAINAAIRLYGVKQKYTREELDLPFIVVRMLFQPNMSDPTQAAIATSMAMGGVNALYTQSPMAALPPAELDVIDGNTPVARQIETQRTETKPVDPQPSALLVEQVTNDMDTGMFTVRLAGGLEVLTDQADVANVAQQAKKAGQRVLVETETRHGKPFITELQVAKSAPAQATPVKTTSEPAPMPDGSTTIVEVKKASGVKKKDGKPDQPWSKYDVTFATGEMATTFSQTIQQLIDAAQQQKARVRITTSEREGYNDNLDSLEIVDKRQQSLPDPGDL